MKRAMLSILAEVKGNVNANGTVGALVEIKKFYTTDGEVRAFVSGRCVKYCVKERLREKGFNISPVKRSGEGGVLQSEGDPAKNIDDDLFGFMVTSERGSQERTRKRFAAVKTDGIVAIRHCEITRDFGGRFDPERKEDPSPFEVEVAHFVGRNNWLITERCGVFEEDETPDGKALTLPSEERRARVRALLEVILKERYFFPRSAVGLHQPNYLYAAILLTERVLPLFSYVDLGEDGRLDMGKIEELRRALDPEREKLFVVKFAVDDDNVRLGLNDVPAIIDEIANFLIG